MRSFWPPHSKLESSLTLPVPPFLLFIFLHCPYWRHYSPYFTYFVYRLLPLEHKLHEGRDFCLFTLPRTVPSILETRIFEISGQMLSAPFRLKSQSFDTNSPKFPLHLRMSGSLAIFTHSLAKTNPSALFLIILLTSFRYCCFNYFLSFIFFNISLLIHSLQPNLAIYLNLNFPWHLYSICQLCPCFPCNSFYGFWDISWLSNCLLCLHCFLFFLLLPKQTPDLCSFPIPSIVTSV